MKTDLKKAVAKSALKKYNDDVEKAGKECKASALKAKKTCESSSGASTLALCAVTALTAAMLF